MYLLSSVIKGANKMCSMFSTVILTSLFISINVFVESRSSEQIKSGDVPEQEAAPIPEDIVYDTTMRFPKGIVPYYIETASYDSIITARIQAAMDLVEASSCVVFHQLKYKPTTYNGSWVHFTNPEEIRDCVHGPKFDVNGEIIIIIGYDCMMFRYLIHAVLHSIGFTDEVTHPHRDQYIRIMWENIQPAYRKLFRIQNENAQYKVVEYDPMSIMHFHDRAFSINGGPTIAPRVPGLTIQPSDKLSQLDVMKLRLWFGHECNKRKVGALLEKCKTVFHNSPSALTSVLDDDQLNQSVEVDDIVDPFISPPIVEGGDGMSGDYETNGENEMDGGNEIDGDNGISGDYRMS